ncbi:MAG: ATP-binding protein [Pseudomonadota bacterium]|nr:ATP-binding protein [Pseudomonadota bacterium]
MSQRKGQSPSDPPRRFRDFFVLTLGSIAVLALLLLTGAIGLVEWITGAIVMTAGALAFYVGSAPQTATSEEHHADDVTLETEPTALKNEIEPFIMALPLPALLISSQAQIQAANSPATNMFRLELPRQGVPVATLRIPELLDAAERVGRDGANERVEFTQHGEAEVWMAHVRPGPETGSVLMVFEDLTAVRRAERARADFLANASHELRTPLTAIGGFIETMRGPAKDDKAAWDGFLEIMGQQTERMKRLVADLLSLSRIEFSEHRTPSTRIDFVDLVRQTSMALDPVAKEAGIHLHFDAPDRVVRTVADEDEIAQVVQNLASNAIKYARKNGEVQILVGVAETMTEAATACSRQSAGSKRALLLQPYASSEARAVWVRVTDNGAGIAEEHLPRLGERFYRVDESRGGKIEGTGLGLAIVKHIMARHRGGLAVESVEGEGTAFGIWMPRLKDDAPDADPKAL